MNLYELHTHPKELLWYDPIGIHPKLLLIIESIKNYTEYSDYDLSWILPRFIGKYPEYQKVIERVILNTTNIVRDNDPVAVIYAREVLHGRWIEAEPIIKQDNDAWDSYLYDLEKRGIIL